MIKKLIVILFCLSFPAFALADWAHSPAYMTPTSDAGNVHYNSGGRRMVRIDGTTLVLEVNGSSDYIKRSTDNGANWTSIDTEAGYSGSMIAGADNYVYHFSRYSGNIRMVKFLYNGTPPAPVNIYTSLESSNHGAYTMLNATVNEDGDLFVFFHHDVTSTSGYDSLLLIRSTDEGVTWTSPITVRAGSSGHSYGYVHSDVALDGDIIITYSEWASYTSQFGVSDDNGATWTHTEIADGAVYNPAILPVGTDDIYIFAQSGDDYGLVFKKSTNSGGTWPTSWSSIQANHGSGYADPSPGLGSDGTVYVAFRGNDEYTALSDDLRSYMAQSTDGGSNWTFPDNHLTGGRVGTRSTIRYQTWWNYGGPLEWTWLEEDSSTDYPTMYDVNTDITIMDVQNIRSLNWTGSGNISWTGTGTITWE